MKTCVQKIRQRDTSLRSSEQVFVEAVPGEAAWLQCGETAPTCEDQIWDIYYTGGTYLAFPIWWAM